MGEPNAIETKVAIRNSYICLFGFAPVADSAGAGSSLHWNLFLEQSGLVLVVLVREEFRELLRTSSCNAGKS